MGSLDVQQFVGLLIIILAAAQTCRRSPSSPRYSVTAACHLTRLAGEEPRILTRSRRLTGRG